MKDWKNILVELAKKLTPPLAFAVLFIVALGQFGGQIPAAYMRLVYGIGLGVPLLWAAVELAQLIRRLQSKNQKPSNQIDIGQDVNKSIIVGGNRNEIQYIVNNYVPNGQAESKPAEKTPPVTDVFAARECYLRAIIRDCSAVRLAGLDPNASDPKRGGMSLEKLYVALDTTTPREKPEEKTKKGAELRIRPDQEREPLSVLEAWLSSANNRMVLLGLPGTGKSTFVRHLALSMANTELFHADEPPKGWQGRPLLPVILSLGRFAESLPADCRQGRAALLENYLVDTLKMDENCCDFAPLVLRFLEHEGALLMFDGLDEVADWSRRPLVVQAVEDFALKYGQKNPESRFLVTCRTYSYRNDVEWELAGWPVHEVALLDRKKIEYFINAWYVEMSRIELARKAEFARKCESLLKYTQPGERRQLYKIASTPLILTMMAITHTHGFELPDTRAQVYEACIKLLLIHWQYRRSIQSIETQRSILEDLAVPDTVLLQALQEVAYHAHEVREEKDGQATLVTEELLWGYLPLYLKDSAKVDLFIKYCESANGLLMLQGSLSAPGRPTRKVYAFPHLTFEEYLAARYLASENDVEKAYPLAGKSDRWREVLQLLGEHLSFGGVPQFSALDAWIEALSNPPAEAAGEEKARMTWLAGEMLVLFRRAFPNKTAHADAKVFAQLREQAIAALPDPRIRANCADLADELGYVPDDLYDFVEVRRDGIPPYWMAKYPVTNSQYARFLKAENFENRDLWVGFPKFDEKCQSIKKSWGDEGWQWLQKQEKENGVYYPPSWRDPRFGNSRPNAPLVTVTWYEANAYCRWLMANWENLEESKLGLPRPKEIRLPTEDEWVLAAGGEGAALSGEAVSKGRFAFGELKDPEKEILKYANTGESGIGRTTPVWIYPQGASPCGIMDMSGNVFEWQANLYRNKDPYIAWRGGSWNDSMSGARVSSRNYYPPNNRSRRLGFRVCALPSDSFVS